MAFADGMDGIYDVDKSGDNSIDASNTSRVDDLETFRRNAHEMIDFIVNYYQHLQSGDIRVVATVAPGYLQDKLPSEAPQEPISFAEVMQQVKQHIYPGITHWQHPNFFGWYPALTSFPSMLADMLSGAFNVQGFTWYTSPAATELEMVTMDWLVKALRLSDAYLSNGEGGGTIQPSASDSTLVALLSARQKCLMHHKMWDSDKLVGDSSKLVAYASDQSHSSVLKGAKCAGVRLEMIAATQQTGYTMEVNRLIDAMKRDQQNGLIPFFVCATIGTTSSGALDPAKDIAEAIQTEFPDDSIWLHVDAAYAGTFALCEEHQHILIGSELFDSFNFNPHKTMRVAFDCAAFYVKKREYVVQSLGITPEYLKNSNDVSTQTPDFKDWQTSLGRRFRSLKLFFVLNMMGLKEIKSHLRNCCKLAKMLETYLLSDDRFEVLNKVEFGLICFKLKNKSNELQEIFLKSIVEENFLLTHTKLEGQFVLRICIGSPYTTACHITSLWNAIQRGAYTALNLVAN